MRFSVGLVFVLITKIAWGYQLEPAIGSGSAGLSLTVYGLTDEIRYDATNRSYYFINLGLGDFSVQAKMPLRDSPEVRGSRVDSQVTDYQFAFAYKKNWHIDLGYQTIKGYYVEDPNRGIFNNPDLQFSRVGGLLTYVFNPEYSPEIERNPSWKQAVSAGSWMLSGGYDQFNINGDLTPPDLNSNFNSSLKDTKARVATVRMTKGHNWLWDRWFAGASLGLGLSYFQVNYDYEFRKGHASNIKVPANVGFSGGYRWDQSKVGMYVRSQSWTISFDDKEISLGSSSSGFYYSSIF